jgi:hypothetical protein
MGRVTLLAGLAAAALAAQSCSPERAKETQGNAPSPTPVAVEPGQNLTQARPAPVAEAQQPATARRCGWLHNPTPGNWWLIDRDGEWVLSTQGSEPVAGMDDMPDMSTAGWAETNGHYGHGCACITITVEPATRRVRRIAAAQPKPLKQCVADKALPKP